MYILHPHIWCFLVFIARGAAECLMTDDTCEFWLEIQEQLTMMTETFAVYPANGQLYGYNETNLTAAQPIDTRLVITADGWERPRLVIAVNKSMPGPPIEVYEGQNLIVHVKNLMFSTAVTVHWHGLHQHGTPWMDGVAFVTQCPILPSQTFTYKFKAYPKGTFWYHAHIGSQLSMGLLGPLIIREKVDPLVEEFIMMIQEWNHDSDGDTIHLKMLYGNYDNRVKINATGSLEGALFSMFPFQSGLINGRGRHYYSNGTHNQAPLTVYTVQQSKTYRFRVIGAGSLYPFRVSIDGHPIKLLASDGYAFQPVLVESFIINPGERYDFEITANQSNQSYWIRAQTLEVNVANHVAEAILRYEGAPSDREPTTTRKQCTTDDRCLIVNCPFSNYPDDTFTDCTRLDELKAAENNSAPGANRDNPEEIEEIFLNFAFPGNQWTPASINGRTFQHPPVSALTQPQELDTYCDPAECGEDQACRCTYTIDLKHNKVYQMVFLNMGIGKGWAHPIHMHGHSFYVLKMGYPMYNRTTGKLLGDNLDIDCQGNSDRNKSFCNSAKWANSSWGGNNIPGIELELPLQKDTIIIPTGGYAVVRIRADNPGVWFIHCHIELHSSDGMALMFNESYPNHPPPPAGFPRCGNFNNDGIAAPPGSDGDKQGGYSKDTFWAVVGPLIGIIVILIIIVIALTCYKLRSKGKALSTQLNSYTNTAFADH